MASIAILPPCAVTPFAWPLSAIPFSAPAYRSIVPDPAAGVLQVDGRAIVPDGWFEEATRRRFGTTYPDRGYGYQWWTLDGGAFAGFGIHGQLLYIDASRRMVVRVTSPAASIPRTIGWRHATLAAFIRS